MRCFRQPVFSASFANLSSAVGGKKRPSSEGFAHGTPSFRWLRRGRRWAGPARRDVSATR